ncbi:unnamed protein product [Amoebophrya sp. A25]|nr:unnamed protein product [Amoebophrya sp. A25]|eukprot:GSA25T00020675001.1
MTVVSPVSHASSCSRVLRLPRGNQYAARRSFSTTATQQAAGVVQIGYENLETLAVTLLRKSGSKADEAATVGKNLVEANLKGVDSHGVGYLPRYVRSALSGNLNVNAELAENSSKSGTANNGPILRLDGQLGYGQVQGLRAMERGVAACRENGGLALVALKNCHHLGRIGAYAEYCARNGFCSVHFTNVAGHEPLVASSNGGEARLGTNPFTVGIPGCSSSSSGSVEPIILDYATSAMALGKVREYMGRGEQVPSDDILLDTEGRVSRDPKVMFPPGNSTVKTSISTTNRTEENTSKKMGALLPFADHKGYALSFMAEVLGGIFTGGNTIHPKFRRDQGLIINSMTTIIFDFHAVSGTDLPLGDEVAQLAAFMKESKLREGNGGEQILIPGEKESRTLADRKKNGVPVSLGTLRELSSAAADVGISENEVRTMLGL